MRTAAPLILAACLAAAIPLNAADGFRPAEELRIAAPLANCHELPSPPAPAKPDPFLDRVLSYSKLALKHRLAGLASYYSGFFDGRKTANGEIFRNGKFSAAHLTLPLGCWIEVKARATGKKLRLRVNDRGPFVNKFAIDLSQAAARYLGVDVARDRHVEFRIIALPGEEPLPEDIEPEQPATTVATTAN